MINLAKVCICYFNVGKIPFKIHLVGEAYEIVLTLDKIKEKIFLAECPTDIRIIKKYGVDERDIFR